MLLPLGLDVLRCFSDEFTKISMDAGARETLANKLGLGQKYLPGGELPTGESVKISEDTDLKQKFLGLVHKARTEGKEPGAAALKGAGGGILAGQLLTGGRLGKQTGLSRLGYRGFGAIGAGLALAEHFGSKHLDSKKAVLPEQMKTAGVVSSAFTPARQLSSGVQTGSIKNIVHAGGSLRPPKVGQKFNFPSEPK